MSLAREQASQFKVCFYQISVFIYGYKKIYNRYPGKKTTQYTTNSSNSEKFLNKWIRRVAVARNFTHHPGE